MSVATELRVENLIAEVRRLAAEQPDFRYKDHVASYERCVYNATDGAPACIMGQAMANIGFPVPVFAEGQNIVAVLRDIFDLSPADWYRASNWLETVQQHQDQGFTWGEAVKDADWVYPLG